MFNPKKWFPSNVWRGIASNTPCNRCSFYVSRNVGITADIVEIQKYEGGNNFDSVRHGTEQ